MIFIKKLLLLCFLFVFTFVSTFVFAQQNETIPITMGITGNIPTSSIFFAIDGEEDTGLINLQPNQTTILSCWGVADDLDGLDDLVSLHSVIYSSSQTRFSPANQSNVYINNSCDTDTWNVNGFWNCTYAVRYYAEPSEWTCIINITNVDSEFYNDTINTTAVVEELVAISLDTGTIDFGLRAVGLNYSADTLVLVYNQGNVPLDLLVDAFDTGSTYVDDSDLAFNCTIGNIPVSYLRFSLQEEEDYLNSIPMVATGSASISLDLQPQFYGSGSFLPTFANTFWAPAIPMNIAGTCTGRIMYIAQVNN